MKNISECYKRVSRPIKILQIGEGNFLRAFVEYGIDVANEETGFNGNVAMIVPRSKKKPAFDKQDGLYTVCLRGQKHGQVYVENSVITCVETVLAANDDYEAFMALAHLEELQFVVSNTTDAGIVFSDEDAFIDCPPKTFPGKLTKFLHERYCFFKGAPDKALTMLPVELIDDNGRVLKECVMKYADLWQMDKAFKDWLDHSCKFVDPLVDRIVAGFPKDEEGVQAMYAELGYEDELLDIAEPFNNWVIGDSSLKDAFPVGSSKWDVEFADDLTVYHERKIRILNGAHTSMVLGAYLAAKDYVGECMADPALRTQLDQSIYDEIIPTIHMPREKAEAFARDVYERFENPFVKHALLSISLNSIAKWKVRVLPTLKDSVAQTGKLPKWLTYSFAALLAFYRSGTAGDGCLVGQRQGNSYEIKDDADKLEFIRLHAQLATPEYVQAVMRCEAFWGEDLTRILGFAEAVVRHLDRMAEIGVKEHIEELGKQG